MKIDKRITPTTASKVSSAKGKSAGKTATPSAGGDSLTLTESSTRIRALESQIASVDITDAGKVENERRLAVELDRAGARETVTRAHREFLPSNKQLGEACTRWQIRPTRLDPMAFNEASAPARLALRTFSAHSTAPVQV